jgi:hypothetical protein
MGINLENGVDLVSCYKMKLFALNRVQLSAAVDFLSCVDRVSISDRGLITRIHPLWIWRDTKHHLYQFGNSKTTKLSVGKSN